MSRLRTVISLVALAVALVAPGVRAQDSPTITAHAPLYKSNKKATSYSPFSSSKPFSVVVRLYKGVSGAVPLLDKSSAPWQETFIVTAKSLAPSAPAEGAISSPVQVKGSVTLLLGATTELPADLASIQLWMTTQVATLKDGQPKTVYAESPAQPVGVGGVTAGLPLNPASVSISGQLVIDSSATWVGPPISGPAGDQGPAGPAGPQGLHGPAGAEGSEGPLGPEGASGPTGPEGDDGPAGPQGDPGPTGTQGPAGDQGPIGVPGPQGPQGPLGNAGVKGILGLQGPEGELGPDGPPGAIGPKGPEGPPGTTGLLGPTGPAGPKGEQGVQGPPGSAGSQGLLGPIGPAGPDGETGPQGPAGAGPGPQGPTGATGPQGTQGLAGPQGPLGNDGRPGPQGEIGPEGTKGVLGLQGPTGLPGTQGLVGAQGAKGELGSQGAPGPTGPQGAQGAAGAAGAQGPPGTTGPQGVQGVVGAEGTQGPPGPQGPADVTTVKTVTEFLLNSAVLQNDNELHFPVQAGETWLFDTWLIVSCVVENPDIKLAFSTPTGTAVQWSALSDGDVGTDHPMISGSGSTDSFAIPGNLSKDSLHLRGTVVTGTVPGNVRLQWAQNTSSVSAIQVEQFSYIRARKL